MSVAVGIDIGAYKHAVAVCRAGEREADRRTVQIAANRAGFRQLASWMETLAAPVSLVVMESSGHYWYNLASHLHRAGIPVAVVNPLESKYFGKRRLQRSKSDKADARTLAALGMHDRPRVQTPLAHSELREAARFTMRLVREQAELCQRIQRLIDLGFPELREAWDDPTCVSALAVLRRAPTARAVARLRLDTLAALKRPGDGGRAIGRAKAEQLQALAKESVAAPELEAQVAFEMRLLIQQHDFLERQIAEAEAQLATLLDGDTARRLLPIPGWAQPPQRLSSPRSLTFGALPMSTSCWPTPGCIQKNRARARKANDPKPAGRWPRPATPICAPRPIGWRSWGSSTTRSSAVITPGSGPPASQR